MFVQHAVKQDKAMELLMNWRVFTWQSHLRHLRTLCAGLALVLAMLGYSPALAESVTGSGAANAVVVAPLSLTSNQSMNFGRIAAGNAAASVVLNPDTLTCTTTGPILRVGACQPAEFTGMGTKKMNVRIQLPNTVTLTRAGGTQTMSITGLGLDTTPDLVFQNGGGNPRYQIAPNSGIFTFRIGGRLNIGANQPSGVYNGSFVVTVQYQ